jgi:ABC-2 type transport system permease protein
VVGYVSALLIYLFIFLYGVQVMRGVIEEKTNRIIEVVISSVKPFELMMGKILGIAFVGLTQFLLWVALSAAVSVAVTNVVLPRLEKPATEKQLMEKVDSSSEQAEKIKKDSGKLGKLVNALSTVNTPLILACFLFYFIGGYLLYSSLFAAIGAAVDNETDTQQFMMPVTIPLVMSFVVAQVILAHPESQMALWMSIIPFTSPIIMMVRLPFNPPAWQIALSMAMLILGFLGTTWLASRIYRVGILMYGKKVTYKELSKWLFYKL